MDTGSLQHGRRFIETSRIAIGQQSLAYTLLDRAWSLYSVTRRRGTQPSNTREPTQQALQRTVEAEEHCKKLFGVNDTNPYTTTTILQARLDGRTVLPGLPVPTDGLLMMCPTCSHASVCVCVCVRMYATASPECLQRPMVGLLVVLFAPLLLSFLAMPSLCRANRVTPQ